MNRRTLLKSIGGAGLVGLASPLLRSQEQVARATRGMATPRIKDISVIECEPAGTRLTVVKITTDQDGLYGYGCATFTQRADLVKRHRKYLKPFLLGKTTDRIEDIWQSCYDSSYWKNGPVLNNALSGVDQALWTSRAGRRACLCISWPAANAGRRSMLIRMLMALTSGGGRKRKGLMAQGFRNVRVQVGIPGMSGYGSRHNDDTKLKAAA